MVDRVRDVVVIGFQIVGCVTRTTAAHRGTSTPGHRLDAPALDKEVTHRVYMPVGIVAITSLVRKDCSPNIANGAIPPGLAVAVTSPRLPNSNSVSWCEVCEPCGRTDSWYSPVSVIPATAPWLRAVCRMPVTCTLARSVACIEFAADLDGTVEGSADSSAGRLKNPVQFDHLYCKLCRNGRYPLMIGQAWRRSDSATAVRARP